ncbi:hypothetical protein ACVR1I_06440 [Streptococcus cameli]
MNKQITISSAEVENIKNEIINVLVKHSLQSGTAKIVLTETINDIENFSIVSV